MNRLLRLFSMLAFFAIVNNSLAQDYDMEVDGIYYKYDTDKMTATVVGAPYETPYSGNLTIPATITRGRFTFNVVSIERAAFNSSKIESITILSDGENGVTTIGDDAFTYCIYMKSAKLPNTLKTMGKRAFQRCI